MVSGREPDLICKVGKRSPGDQPGEAVAFRAGQNGTFTAIHARVRGRFTQDIAFPQPRNASEEDPPPLYNTQGHIAVLLNLCRTLNPRWPPYSA